MKIILCLPLLLAVLPASGGPLLKPLFISAHRAGGTVFAPDNSLPNIEHAAALGVSAIEIDLQPTADGGLILFHDSAIPRGLVEPEYTGPDKLRWSDLTRPRIARLRYSATVHGRRWKQLAIADADDVIRRYRAKFNFHLDVKHTPAARVIKLLRDHDLARRAIVMSRDLEYLAQVRAGAPGVTVEWVDNLLGRYRDPETKRWVWYPVPQQHELFEQAMTRFEALGGGLFCTKGLTAEKVEICHRHGIAVRPSAAQVKEGDGEAFLRLGVDGLLCDNPEAVLQAVQRTLGADYLPRRGMTAAEIFAPLQRK